MSETTWNHIQPIKEYEATAEHVRKLQAKAEEVIEYNSGEAILVLAGVVIMLESGRYPNPFHVKVYLRMG